MYGRKVRTDLRHLAVHDDRKTESKSEDIALKIHQDADHLDHFGSLDIWKFICYTVGHNNSIEDALVYLQNGRLDDETRWRSELHFDLSRKIQGEKLDFARKYFERLRVECAGKIWQEDTF